MTLQPGWVAVRGSKKGAEWACGCRVPQHLDRQLLRLVPVEMEQLPCEMRCQQQQVMPPHAGAWQARNRGTLPCQGPHMGSAFLLTSPSPGVSKPL